MSELKQISSANGWYAEFEKETGTAYSKILAIGLFAENGNTTIDGLLEIEQPIPVSIYPYFSRLVYLPNETRQTWIEEPNKV